MNEVRGKRHEGRGTSCELRAKSLSIRIPFINLNLNLSLSLNLNLNLNLNLGLSLILFLNLCSCKHANPRTVKLWVEMSDTMVQRLINEQQPAMDSLCLKKTDSLFRIAYDSIYQKRLTEIRKLIDSSHHDEFPVR